ncbi:WfaX, partial [human gut metagenome]
YVVTNSFHGTAFSVIFNKNLFVEFKNKSGRNIRSEGLLKSLGIDREIVDGNCRETEINWYDVNEKIKNQTIISLDYLKSFVSGG